MSWLIVVQMFEMEEGGAKGVKVLELLNAGESREAMHDTLLEVADQINEREEAEMQIEDYDAAT